MALPPIRPELRLNEGPRGHDGQPGWVLHDPATNRYYRLDWVTFEVLRYWSLGEPQLIMSQITATTPLQVSADDLEAVLQFLLKHELLETRAWVGAAEMEVRKQQADSSWWKQLLHHYLFFRVPLIRPEPMLHALRARLGWIFRPYFWWSTLAALAVGLALAWRQSEELTAACLDLANVRGFFASVAVFMTVKVVHEIGHGLVATHFGCRVPTMGLAFLVMTPVAYTDVTDSWRLPRRAPRLWIGAAGLLAELVLAVWATFAWTLLPDGGLRTATLIVATVTWVKSLAVNLSPIMRFDGYYLLSDWLDIPNLHQRCFALTRWQLREWLFALGERPPEHFRTAWRRGLVALGGFIWLYRLVVFLGIAVFVYHYFFKALGIVLFAVELVWFILWPVCSEIQVWYKRRRMILRSNRARWVTGMGFTAVIFLLIPWPRKIRVAAELHPNQEFHLVAPESAELVELPMHDGAEVTAGAPLAVLRSRLLEFNVAQARLRSERARTELAAVSVDSAQQSRLGVAQAMFATAEAERKTREDAIKQLRPRAPFGGVIRWHNAPLIGENIARHERYATLAGTGPNRAVAYVDENMILAISLGAAVRFYPEACPERSFPMRVTIIETDAARVLTHPLLATAHGGTVPARLVDQEWLPAAGTYRVFMQAEAPDAWGAPRVQRGLAVIDGGWGSWGRLAWRRAFSVIWREFGF